LNNRFLHRLRSRALPNLRHLGGTRIRRCRCCGRLSVIVSLSPGEEVKRCLLCGANLRYEMLAVELRKLDLSRLEVLELDPDSPLRGLLSRARGHVRSYFAPDQPSGSIGPGGARREDITALSFPDASLDLIVSSDVLEHVPDLKAAFAEMARVLRPGGAHLFTVPPRQRTRRRPASEAEYHADPLDPRGILVHWDFGPDSAKIFSTAELELAVVAGPEGLDGRLVWRAEKISHEGGASPATPIGRSPAGGSRSARSSARSRRRSRP
jgi:SAM-dependent methyltransferase